MYDNGRKNLKMDLVFVPKPKYKYINRADDLTAVKESVVKYPVIEVDTETTGLNPYTSKVSLVQIGTPGGVYVIDVRHDTDHSDIHGESLSDILTGNNQLRILQNAVFDSKMTKVHFGYYIDNVYDTMLAENILTLGLGWIKCSLQALVEKYLGMTLSKEVRGTFEDYYQDFKPHQLDYAATDVCTLTMIMDAQLIKIKREGLERGGTGRAG